MIVTRGYGKPTPIQRKGGKVVTYGYSRGIPVIFYAIVARTQRKPRSQSSFEQLLIASSAEASMMVGTLTANQSLESSEPSNAASSSRTSSDASSTMDDMTRSSHEESQEASSQESALIHGSGEYDETKETRIKAEEIDG